MRISDYIARLTLDTKGSKKDLDDFDVNTRRTANRASKNFDVVGGSIRKNIGLLATIGIGGGLLALTANAAALEEGFIGVQKTTGLTDQQIESLKDEILDLGTELPVTIDKIIETTKVAGQLGIVAESGSAGLLKFTEAFTKLEIASDRTISGELGAQQFARFLENSGAGVDAADKLGSAITFLGNTSKLTEGQLLSTASEIAKVSKTFAISAGSVLGISAAFTELSVQPEVARTTVLKFFKAVEDASLAGKGLDELVELTGLTADEIRNLRKTKPEEILVKFAQGIDKARKSNKSINDELKELSLNGTIVFSALSALSANSQVLSEKIDGSNVALEKNVALNQEVAAASNTFNASVIKLKNSFVGLGDQLAGSGFIGFLADSVDGLTAFVKISDKAIENLDVLRSKNVSQARSRVESGEAFLSDLPDSQANAVLNVGKNRANLIDSRDNFFGRLFNGSASDNIDNLIESQSPILGNPGFIQRGFELDLFSESQLNRIRQIRAEQFNDRQPGISQNVDNGSPTTVEVNNQIHLSSDTPEQAAQQISQVSSEDIALSVGQ